MKNSNSAKTVMLVEPEVLVRMVIAEYLRDCGYRVIEGVSAQDVWTVLESDHRVDVILAEVRLAGGADGFSLASRIRQTHPSIDVILSSGVAGASQGSHELCQDGPIKKPYEPKDVEARIRILLERRRTASKA